VGDNVLKPRSKLLFISGIWTLIYALMIRPTLADIEGIQAILVVIIVWPGFLLFQIICYAMFKKYQNQRVYVLLILLKTSLFLIQPVMIEYQMHNIFFILSILGVFLIDYHIMTLENKVNLNDVHVSDQEQKKIFEQYKASWFLAGSVVLLFALYFQLKEGNYNIIIPYSLFYLFLILGKQQPKIKYICTQLLGLVAIYLLVNFNVPELLKGILLISVLLIIYHVNKFIFNKEKTLNTEGQVHETDREALADDIKNSKT